MRRPCSRGYMLLETTVAILVLGIVAVAIHGATRQSIQTRGQAQDFTKVAFLMEDFLAKLETQHLVVEGERKGTFDEYGKRFDFHCVIRPVLIPAPVINTSNDPEQPAMLVAELPAESSFLVHVALTVTWNRGEMPFEETIETLLPPSQLHIPEPLVPIDEGLLDE